MKSLIVLHGVVQHGKKRGRDLGFPTINFSIPKSSREGIFISQTVINEEKYNSLTFIGVAKTYNESLFQAETYLLDFTNDIYGQEVTVHILKKIRANKKFESEEALIQAMSSDRKAAEEFFKK